VDYVQWRQTMYNGDSQSTMKYCTGWQRPIECLKLQVSFHKRATNYGSCIQIGECIVGVYTPLFEQSSLLWSDPVGARRLCAKALRRRTPRALLRKMTYIYKASYDSMPPCTWHRQYVVVFCTTCHCNLIDYVQWGQTMYNDDSQSTMLVG